MTLDDDGRARRRRGTELDTAILRAAWDELEENGYPHFTFDAVAERAHTSRSVLYRRWPDAETLAVAALRERFDRNAIVAPDTGSLRGDMIARLRSISDRRGGVVVMIGMQLAGVSGSTGVTLAQARERLLDGVGSDIDVSLERAQARGELEVEALPTSVRSVPFDLLRQRLLMDPEPVTDEEITAIVDEVFLPLVAHYSNA